MEKMSGSEKIVKLTAENYETLGCPCFLNPKHIGHLKKLEWLENRFVEGFTIKSLFIEGEKKPIGFIEYVSGEFAWRAVDALGYLFIHCIWVSPNKYKKKGFGSYLIADCIEDAKKQGKLGVAVIVSGGPFIANKDLFLKNGFVIAETDDNYELLAKQFNNDSILPKFRNWRKQLSQYKGLNIVYSKQCPWVVRFIEEISEILTKNQLNLKVIELKNPKEAQDAPSIYSTFTLINDGKILSDHYISITRFLNILKKDLKILK